MVKVLRVAVITTSVAVFSALAPAASAQDNRHSVQLGPRPFYLVEGMDPGPLKDKLVQCENGPFQRTDFSIGHRGAALQFPEHTKEAYEAGARMGAGIVECDATFTSDKEFVCRHAENDLHTTTNILQTPLAATCKTGFTPAFVDGGGQFHAATADCHTSALTLDQFRTLRGKMDAFNPNALTVDEFVGGTPSFRTDLYTGRGTLMTLRESIRLNEKNGVKHTPELKGAASTLITGFFGSQDQYAQAFADVLADEGVKPKDAFPQSFNVNDVLYWIEHTEYGDQAVFLVDYDADADNILLFDTDGHQLVTRQDQLAFFTELKAAKVKIIAPAMPALLAVNGAGAIVPSQLAKDLTDLGFKIITWTFERADLRRGASNAGFYFDFDPTGAAIKKDSDMYKALDVLAREVKILGIFSDWPATVTYYANCMKLK
jgi:glycerophosphoryl diester phosphodiesterase